MSWPGPEWSERPELAGSSVAPTGGSPDVPEVRRARVSDRPLSVDAVLAAVADRSAGGVCVFIGAVRDVDEGRPVELLEYSAHPTAADRLREVAERVAYAHRVTAVAVDHRVGELAIGDVAVVVAVSAPHRGEAFAACRDLIDTLKVEVPLWKRQMFADGDAVWVGTDSGSASDPMT